MDNKVAAFAATPDPTFGQKPAPSKPPATEAAAAVFPAPSWTEPALRLSPRLPSPVPVTAVTV